MYPTIHKKKLKEIGISPGVLWGQEFIIIVIIFFSIVHGVERETWFWGYC